MKRERSATAGFWKCQECGGDITGQRESVRYKQGYWHLDCCPVANPTTIRVAETDSEITLSDVMTKVGKRRVITGMALTIVTPNGEAHEVRMSPEFAHVLANQIHTRVRANSSKYYR